jgi:hypothetical protein
MGETMTVRAGRIRVGTLAGVPPRIIVLTGVASLGAAALAIASGWPLWAIAGVAVVPVIPLASVELSWTYRHYGWLAFFYLLVVTQTGHFIEHIVQMVQIHVLDEPPTNAHGIFGQLDVEWVHVIFNTWVLIAVVGLLLRFPSNRWLWLGALIAGWHEIEHLYIIFFYVRDGVGGPGLLADGGRIGGGIGVRRPDLHFVYNLLETLPIYIGFAIEVRRSYDRWLATAFPRLSREQLVRLTSRLRTVRYPAGATIVRTGELSDSMYVVASGGVDVVRPTAADVGRTVATLRPGQVFGEIGLLRDVPRTATVLASEPSELIRLDRRSVDELLTSPETATDLQRLIRERDASPDEPAPPPSR